MALCKLSDVFQLPETLKEIETSISSITASSLGITATNVDFDNTGTTLESSNTQEAIVEIDEALAKTFGYDSTTISKVEATAFESDHYRVQLNTTFISGYKNRFDIADNKLRVRIYDTNNTVVSDKSVTLS